MTGICAMLDVSNVDNVHVYGNGQVAMKQGQSLSVPPDQRPPALYSHFTFADRVAV